jgi:hypothetical protein
MAANDIFVLVFVAVMAALLIRFRKELRDIIDELNNRLGGPPGPMGPVPSTDAHLLLKRWRKSPL